MKAERRHQLQENSLVHMLEAAPFFFRKYGTQLLLGLLIVLLVIVLIRNRAQNAQLAEEEGRKSLTNARFAIQSIPHIVPQGSNLDPKDSVERLAKAREGIEQQLNFVFEHGDDPAILAEARLARGDLNWELSNYPRFPEAATRPSLKLDKSPNEFLDAAAKEYQNVAADTKAPQVSRTTACFSLAAVAENQRKWDDAKAQYQSIAGDPNVDATFKAEARQRLAMLDAMKVDQYVTQVTPPESIFAPLPATTQSSTSPAATGPAASRPATTPASAPATAPAPAKTAAPAAAQPDLPVEKK